MRIQRSLESDQTMTEQNPMAVSSQLVEESCKVAALNPSSEQLLNIGCGQAFHASWINVDLVPADDSVIECDIKNGLPFDDDRFDAVYHSHVLEHLSPADGRTLLKECYRVLRPGGVVRVVVPDLEQIAKLYLQKHQLAWQDDSAVVDYHWMKLELLDQMVRRQSGGQMGRYISSGAMENLDFVRSRLGQEVGLCQASATATSDVSWRKRWAKTRVGIARRLVGWLLGDDAMAAFDEGLFRQHGEVHRWMYDRFSLRQLLGQCGFSKFSVQTAATSQINQFANFQLDACDGQVRKPDSIFVEAIKAPQQAN